MTKSHIVTWKFKITCQNKQVNHLFQNHHSHIQKLYCHDSPPTLISLKLNFLNWPSSTNCDNIYLPSCLACHSQLLHKKKKTIKEKSAATDRQRRSKSRRREDRLYCYIHIKLSHTLTLCTELPQREKSHKHST